MKKYIYVLFIILINYNNLFGLEINKVNGALTNGQIIEIYGKDFGIKKNAKPIKWETFENGIIGKSAETDGYWYNKGSCVSEFTYENQRSTKCGKNIKITHTPTHSEWLYHNNVGFAKTGFVYINFWILCDYVNGDDSWQLKLWRLNSNGLVHGSYPNIAGQSWVNAVNPTEQSQNYSEVHSADGYHLGNLSGITTKDGYWCNVSVAYKASTLNNKDGEVTMWISYADNSYPIKCSKISNITTKLTGYNIDIDNLSFGYLIESGGLLAVSQWDNIYMDNTWARVEIGDNSEYANCKHREIQVPNYWSRIGNPDQEIRVTVNQGSFTDGSNAYLFVIDEDGIPSKGYPVTFQN